MPQRLDYPVVPEKRWEWHLVLFKEWLRAVQPGLGERKYTKWLRTKKVFERKFIGFAEQLLGVERGDEGLALGEVGEELLEALEKSEKDAEAAQAAALQGGPGRDMPRPSPAPAPAPPPAPAKGFVRKGPRREGAPPPPPPARPAANDSTQRGPRPAPRGDDDEEAPEGADAAPALGPPAPETDAFLKALLERFTELNGYLSMFVLREIADGFLGPAELMKRIGASGFQGKRPNMAQLEGWIRWMEWLGGLKKVGFRHKAGTAAREIGAYLVEMPVEELLAQDDEPEEPPEVAEEEPAAPAPAPAPPPARPAPDDDDDDEGQHEGDDEDLGDEGLDLPPETEAGAADVVPYWKKAADEPTPAGKLAELTRGLSQLTSDLDDAAGGTPATRSAPVAVAPPPAPVMALGGQGSGAPGPAALDSGVPRPATGRVAPRAEPAAAPPAAAAAEPAERAGPAPVAPSTDSTPRGPGPAMAPAPTVVALAAVAPAPAAAAPAPSRRDAVAGAFGWWLDGAGTPSLAQAAEIRLGPHPSGKPVGLFKLLALGSLLEAAPPDQALALFKALDGPGLLEAHLVEGAPLERLLEAAWAHGAAPALEERLVHLPRFRKGLLALPFKALSPSQEARALARTLRDAVTGPALGAGLAFVMRELGRGGWRLGGVDAVDWLPFP